MNYYFIGFIKTGRIRVDASRCVVKIIFSSAYLYAGSSKYQFLLSSSLLYRD